MFNVYERIIQICNQKNIESLNELATITKISQSTLAGIKRGKSARVDTIEKICSALGVSLAEFFSPDVNTETIEYLASNPELLNVASLIHSLPLKTRLEVLAFVNFKQQSDKGF